MNRRLAAEARGRAAAVAARRCWSIAALPVGPVSRVCPRRRRLVHRGDDDDDDGDVRRRLDRLGGRQG
eukprot:5579765-Prymnesium_polylepis.1